MLTLPRVGVTWRVFQAFQRRNDSICWFVGSEVEKNINSR